MTDTRKITYSAMLLAIAMISMVVKGAGPLFVVFITGAVVNACIILATFICGLPWGIVLSVITPVAAYFISPNPVHQAVPVIVPAIMAGNAVLAVVAGLIAKNRKDPGSLTGKIMLPFSMLTGSVAKSAFMGAVISLLILPNLLPADKMGQLPTLQYTFSVVQLFAALVGSIYALIVLGVFDRVSSRPH